MRSATKMGRIVARKKDGHTYYSYIRTYRVKVDQSQSGKTRGSGKSKVVTESVYLGTADEMLKKLAHEKPLEIYTKAFGLPCALWKMAQELDVVGIVNRVIEQKRKRQVSLGAYVVLAAINQVGHSASKNGLGKWYESTVLPRISGIAKEQLTSQHFWNAFEEIVSEKALDEKKQEEGIAPASKLGFEELERLLDDSQIEEIESQLWQAIAKKFDLSPDVMLYDGTNFYTFMDEGTAANIPQRCGSNKQKRFDKRQIGLALAVLRQWGIPIFHKLYGGQTNEQCLFPTAIATLVERYGKIAGHAKKPTLIFDQGSNSQDNFDLLRGKVHFIGSLSPCDYPELAVIPLSQYENEFQESRFCYRKMQVYRHEALVITTYSAKLQRKDRLTFNKRLETVQNSLTATIRKSAGSELDKLKEQLLHSLDSWKICSSRASQYLEVKDYANGSGTRCLKVVRKTADVTRKRLTFGKRIIFTDLLDDSPEKILREYQGKQTVEEDFKILKDRQYVSMWPIFHWTDTKIRVHAFITVLALLLVKLVEFQVRAHGIQISGKALVNELQDITECLLVYNTKDGERKLSALNTNQKDIFDAIALEAFL